MPCKCYRSEYDALSASAQVRQLEEARELNENQLRHYASELAVANARIAELETMIGNMISARKQGDSE